MILEGWSEKYGEEITVVPYSFEVFLDRPIYKEFLPTIEIRFLVDMGLSFY